MFRVSGIYGILYVFLTLIISLYLVKCKIYSVCMVYFEMFRVYGLHILFRRVYVEVRTDFNIEKA